MKIQHLVNTSKKADLERKLGAHGFRNHVSGHYTLEAQPWRVWVVEKGKIVRSYHI